MLAICLFGTAVQAQLDVEIVYPIEGVNFEMNSLSKYLMRAEVEVDTLFDVQGVNFLVDGRKIRATEMDGQFVAINEAFFFGNQTIIAIAYDKEANEYYDTVQVNFSNQVSSQTVTVLDRLPVNFGAAGRNVDTTVVLPQFVGAYDTIIAHFSVSCPIHVNGCDDWDRVAWVDIVGPNGQRMELLRYITPYNIACGQSMDVSDYASMLQGEVKIHVFIDTWVDPAWEVNLDLEYRKGSPTKKYSKVDILWDGRYDFGNIDNLQPLDTIQLDFAPGADSAKMKVFTTGHGWGQNNTGNAAEFYYANHFFKVGNIDSLPQDLFVECSVNPAGCTGQWGNETSDRAGWCPGALGELYEYNMTPYMATAPHDFMYILEPGYVDLCRSNHPNCVSGVTCTDCNDGYNPHYYISANLVSFGDELLETSIMGDATDTVFTDQTINTSIKRIPTDIGLKVYPNPANSNVKVYWKSADRETEIRLTDLQGRTVLSETVPAGTAVHNISLDGVTDGVYLILVDNGRASAREQLSVIR